VWVKVKGNIDSAMFIDGIRIGTDWGFTTSTFRILSVETFLRKLAEVTRQAFEYIGTVTISKKGLVSMGMSEEAVNKWDWSDIEALLEEHWGHLVEALTEDHRGYPIDETG
jgi:hypothetical protein